MIDAGLIYLAITGALLLVALGLGARVLRGIVRDGRDRQHRRRAGEVEEYTEDEEYGQASSTGTDDDTGEAVGPTDPDDSNGPTDLTDPTDPGGRADQPVTCPKCGATNEPEFDYCRRCTGPLRY